MRCRSLILTSIVVVVLLATVAVAALWRLPADTLLPVHWDAAGEPDRFATALFALFLPVILAAGLSALFATVPRIEPLQDELTGSAALLKACWLGLLAIACLMQITIAAPAFDLEPPARLPLIGVGVLLIIVGNFLPKSRPGFFVGIRTPWAVTNTDNWVATNRFGSRAMMTGGLMIVLAALLPITVDARTIIVVSGLILTVFSPSFYSLRLWIRRKPQA